MEGALAPVLRSGLFTRQKNLGMLLRNSKQLQSSSLGRRTPCSQLSTAFTLTLIMRAKPAWLTLNDCRIARICPGAAKVIADQAPPAAQTAPQAAQPGPQARASEGWPSLSSQPIDGACPRGLGAFGSCMRCDASLSCRQ